MAIPRWTALGYPTPQKWAFKKDMPAHLKSEARRIDFGLFGVAWVAIDINQAVLMKDGQRMLTYSFHLKTPGYVIGPRDMQAAACKPWAFEWQTACADRNMERFNNFMS